MDGDALMLIGLVVSIEGSIKRRLIAPTKIYAIFSFSFFELEGEK
jgi:hypothetical protein